MNTRSKAYMQNSEFKERQGSFAFFCAQAFDYLVQFKTACLDGWKALFKTTQQETAAQMPLAFIAVPTLERTKP